MGRAEEGRSAPVGGGPLVCRSRLSRRDSSISWTERNRSPEEGHGGLCIGSVVGILRESYELVSAKA
jgi:hypothetical protein